MAVRWQICFLAVGVIFSLSLDLAYSAVTFVSGNVPDDSQVCGSVVEGTTGDLSITLVATFGAAAASSANPYTIVSQNVTNMFEIKNDDEIHLATGFELDFEDVPSYILNIKATDNTAGTALTATSDCIITITDVNESPVFPTGAKYNFQVVNGAAAGTEVGTVTSTDPDSTSTGNAITYSITGGDDNNVFAIDNDGKIKVATGKTIDINTASAYVLTVKAASSGTGSPFNSKDVRIGVKPICSGSAIKTGNSFTTVAMLATVMGFKYYLN